MKKMLTMEMGQATHTTMVFSWFPSRMPVICPLALYSYCWTARGVCCLRVFPHTDRDGRQVQRIYNVFGDPVYEKATNAGGENPCISTWRYDSLGRLVHAVCDGHSYEYRLRSLSL